MSDYVVSAIVSTYNSEALIEHRLRNLLQQTLGDKVEIIVVDSGSEQGEKAIVQGYAKKHTNITYLRTESRETLYAAWNRGLGLSAARYVTNANTDDVLRADALEIMAGELDRHPGIALVYGDFLITSTPNATFDDHVKIGRSIKPEYSAEIMLTGCHMGPQPMWRRQVHQHLGYFDDSFTVSGDHEFWCRVATKYDMKHIGDYLGLYYHNTAGIANSNRTQARLEKARIRERYHDVLPPPRPDVECPAGYYYQKPVACNSYVNVCLVATQGDEGVVGRIESVVASTRYPYIVTVIDNASEQATRDRLRGLKHRGLINNLVRLDSEVALPVALNIAWLVDPECKYYLWLRRHAFIHGGGWLEEMIALAEEERRLGVLTCDLGVSSPRPATTNEASGTSWGCVLIPSDVRSAVGFWSENAPCGQEERDYRRRAELAGLRNEHKVLSVGEGRQWSLPARLLPRGHARSRRSRRGLLQALADAQTLISRWRRRSWRPVPSRLPAHSDLPGVYSSPRQAREYFRGKLYAEHSTVRDAAE